MRFSSGGKPTVRILDSTDYKHEWLLQRICVTVLEEDVVEAQVQISFLEARIIELEDDRKMLLKRLWESEEATLTAREAFDKRDWEFKEQVKRADHYRDILKNLHNKA